MLGKLTGQHVTDGGLDLTGREGHLLVVGGKLPSLASDALEDVVELMMLIPFLLMPVSGWTCLRTL